MSFCGIDIGTTGCKAAVYDRDGRHLSQTYREYPALHLENGFAELDSLNVWRLVCEVLAQAALESKDDPIEAISVSSLGEAVVPVTAERKILDNSILCSDCRGQEYVDELLSKITAENFYKINPNLPGIGYSMPKLRWIKEHAADVYEQADYFLTWADFVCFMLGGQPCCCRSLASRTLLYDLNSGNWSSELISLAGLNDIRGKLGRIVDAGEIVGQVDQALADSLGLAGDVKVVAGGHDQCCNAFGAGVDAGSAVYGIGTFACITPVFDKISNTGQMLAAGLGIENHIAANKYVTFIYNQAGALVKWFRDTFVSLDARESDDIFARLSSEMPADPSSLFVLPYFEPTGPPKYVANGGGVIAGLRTATTRGEILKAIMESTTMYLLDACTVLQELDIMPAEFVATGGGAKSNGWLQIKADIFGRPFVRKNITECSCLGAAMLAAKGMGVEFADGQLLEVDRIFEPNPAMNEIYKEKIIDYKQMVKKMLQ